MPGPVAQPRAAIADRDPARPLLILAALPLEVRRLSRVPDAVVGAVGLGAADLSRRGSAWLALRPGAVLVTGLGGGCAPDVTSGDLVVGTAVGGPGGAWLAPDERLVARARRALEVLRLPHRAGRILTAPAVVGTPQAKAECWRAHGALAVDMESAHVLAWAAEAGVPALAVRAVADGPADRLPAELARAIGAGGQLRWTTVLGWTAHPALLADAFRLWRRSARALGRLARFLDAFARPPDR